MTEEENILKMVIEKENWEEVIYYIVSLENIDPWDVDLVKLTGSFIKFIKNIEDLDFRIPAKVVFVAAILLRLKSDNLSIFEEEDTDDILKEQKPFAELGIDPNLVQLGYPMKRIPKRQVTLDELVTALRKALAVTERRTERTVLARKQLTNIGMEEEDLTKKTEVMMKEIDDLLNKLHQDKIEFKKVVKEWKRDKIVEKFVPLLHLEHDKKIVAEQEDFFKEIMISKKTTST